MVRKTVLTYSPLFHLDVPAWCTSMYYSPVMFPSGGYMKRLHPKEVHFWACKQTASDIKGQWKLLRVRILTD